MFYIFCIQSAEAEILLRQWDGKLELCIESLITIWTIKNSLTV